MATPSINKLAEDVSYLNRDMAVVNTLVGRLDTTIDKLTDISSSVSNLLAVHEDTRIMMRRGLTCIENDGELGLRGTGGSSILESFGSKQMIRNLCASQKYHPMTHF